MFVLIAVHVLDGVLNFDSIIGVWYMWIVSVTGIARHSTFGVDSSSFKTLYFLCSGSNSFVRDLRSVCFSSVFGYRGNSLSNAARASAVGHSMD